MEAECCRRCGAAAAATRHSVVEEEEGSTAWHRAWVELEYGAKRRHGSRHRNRRFEGKLVAEAEEHSMVERRVGAEAARWSTRRQKWLERQRWSEKSAQDKDTHGPSSDGLAVTLSQGLAEATWECEAPERLSSCHSAVHGFPHRAGSQTNHEQNELGTDLGGRR